VYDVDYLHVLHAIAPNAIVLTEASPGVISALYRQAAVVIDATPRPRSAANLLRAIACGALPLLAQESPLTRITGDSAPSFSSRSRDACAQAIHDALTMPERAQRVETLRAQLASRRDQQASLTTVLEVYSRLVTTV